MLLRLVLCVENKALQQKLKEALEKMDVNLESYSPGRFAWQKVIRSCADVVVIDEATLPPPTESSIAALNELPENPATIILHRYESSEEQAALVAAGADVLLHADIPVQSITQAIEAVLDSRLQYAGKTSPASPTDFRPRLSDFRSNAESMQVLLQEVRQVIPSNAQLLITGETGVGKERLARAIHAESPRNAGPFVAVNTAALPEQLLESELFGHVQGAFTGAVRSRRGAFEMAHRGTIFLDEIGEMPIHLQAKLLRTLQDFEVKPLGGEKTIWVDTRVIAATNRDLDEAVKNRTFRNDLFYRLGVITLTIPPLRDRREDIPYLVEEFMRRQRTQLGHEVEGVSDEAMEALTRYDWPGNLRELFNVLERAMILCRDAEITIRELPHVFRKGGGIDLFALETDAAFWKGKTLQQVLDESQARIERSYLEALLRENKGRIGNTARTAGLSPRSLYTKMKKLGLDKKNFK